MRTSLVQSLAKFIADPEQLERTFTGEESVSADDSYKFKQEVMRLAASESVKWVRDIEGSVTVTKQIIKGANMQQTPAPQEHILQFFAYEHLPERLQAVSAPFGVMAQNIVDTLPRNPERTVALRKLLEAKDAAVRALVAKT